jgi:succinate dehydrogenase flavin-adding protein (antitoxin of CptAB toxin-antitoxin module)
MQFKRQASVNKR